MSIPEKDLTCSLCNRIFDDPYGLSCSHAFCHFCLWSLWGGTTTGQCPVCGASSEKPSSFQLLKTLCDRIRQKQTGGNNTAVPSSSSQVSQNITVPSSSSQVSQNITTVHSSSSGFGPNGGADPVQKLLAKQNALNETKTNYEQTLEHITFQDRHTEMQTDEEFRKLYQFLDRDKAARITKLREEEQQKSQMMRKKIEALNIDASIVANVISQAESTSRTTINDVLALQVPQSVSGALIDVAKHLGNLSFRVWDKMKDIFSYTPVILDPNTAHPEYTLSDDLTSVRRGARQNLPDNTERFDQHAYVLGSESFNSGTHSWDVEVGGSSNWAVGVLAESCQRKGTVRGPHWGIGLHEGKYRAFSSGSPLTDLTLNQRPQKIRVQLDCAQGDLSFCDPDNRTHIHTFKQTFTEKLFPLIFLGDGGSLKILP